MKLISLNIEGYRHYERIVPFFKKENADVLCLQEVLEPDFLRIKEELGLHGFFKPICFKPYGENGKLEKFGTAILSRTALSGEESFYYRGSEESIVPFVKERYLDTHYGALLRADIMLGGVTYSVASTHFTWTYDGKSDEHQHADTDKLLAWLEGKELILCGDFNAPRANGVADGEVHARFAERFMDNIPAEVVSTIDETLHRAGKLDYVVDHLWTTPSYKAENVRIVNRVSDHCAIVADISKTT